jgi:tetratricopeptide (TPR) repeat protein
LSRGRLELALGRLDAAMKYLNESSTLARELKGPRDIAVAEVLAQTSHAYMWKDDLAAAERTAREAVDIYRTVLPRLHPDRVDAEASLGEALALRRKFTEATAVLNEVLNSYRQIYGDDNSAVANTLDSLARIAWAQHRLAEAEDLARQGLEREIKAHGLDHNRTGIFRMSLGVVQIERGKYAEAELQCRAALAVFEKIQPVEPEQQSAAEYYLGVALLGTHRPQEAETYFRRALDRSSRRSEADWRVARAASGLGAALYDQGRAGEAEPYLVSGYRTVISSQDADALSKEMVRNRVVRFYTERRQSDRLQALME